MHVSAPLSYQAYPRARPTEYDSLVCMDALGNDIGEGGAVALVEGLKGMHDLKELNLWGEFSMYGIARSLVYDGWIQGNVVLLREV